jgi:hypothetical protein
LGLCALSAAIHRGAISANNFCVVQKRFAINAQC